MTLLKVVSFILCVVAVSTSDCPFPEGDIMCEWYEDYEYTNPSGCEENFRWGENCQYKRCECYQGGCPSETDMGENSIPCCGLCSVKEQDAGCTCDEHCGSNCCTGCPGGKVDAVKGMEMEFFNLSNPSQVVRSGEKFRNRSDAEVYCAKQGRELVYTETQKAVLELEMYVNKYIEKDGGQHKFWMDGKTYTIGNLYDADWPMPRPSNKKKFCMGLANYGYNPRIWKPRGMECNATHAFQTKEALCADRTYKYKLIVVEHENGELKDQSESGQICYDMGKELALTHKYSDYLTLLVEFKRIGIIPHYNAWISGVFEGTAADSGKLVPGDSYPAIDSQRTCVASARERQRMLKLDCGLKHGEKTICYDIPRHEPRYSAESGAVTQ